MDDLEVSLQFSACVESYDMLTIFFKHYYLSKNMCLGHSCNWIPKKQITELQNPLDKLLRTFVGSLN